MQDLLSFAHRLADEARRLIETHFRTPFDIDPKEDSSPVTIADRAVERRLREIIEDQRPADGILGEEFDAKESENGITWVIDPIDGTKSFIVGRPTFGTLIAAWDGDTPLLGVIDQPILKERWSGDGTVTTFNGRAVRTRACQSLGTAVATCTSPAQIPTLWPSLYESCKAVVWGGDCYSYGLLACGWIDICVETGLKPHDFAALVPIVTGAGGWIGDWTGRPLTLRSSGETLALGDASIRDDVLKLLRAA